MSTRERLEELAALYGVQSAHWDGLGHHQIVSDDALLAIVRALGADVHSPTDAEEASRRRRIEIASRVLEPVATIFGGGAPRARLRVPEAGRRGPYRLEVRLETGEVRRLEGHVEELHVAWHEDVEGRRVAVLDLPCGDPLPSGYHELALELDGETHACALVAAPWRAHRPADLRAWGLFLPLHALRTARASGAADLTDLESMVELVASRGGSVVGTLPLTSAFLDRPLEPSPYAPVSRLFWNEMYLDPAQLPELDSCPRARDLLASEAWKSERDALARAPLVDYRAHAAMRRRIVEALAERFFESPSGDGLAKYIERHPRALDYARFRATCERRPEAWHAWPGRAWSGHLQPGDWDERALRYHLYSQWRTDEQLARVAREARAGGLGLYLDLPLGVHPDGYDAWRERDAFLPECSAGAPPDPLFTGGQDWGFRPASPEGARRQRYRYFRDCLRRQMELAGVLRMDHVMGLHRIYCVPRGMGATQGAYLRYPAEELYAVLLIESERHATVVVGEDLGTVPDEVREAMTRHGLLRMHVVQFGLEPHGERVLVPPPADALASVNTHDLPTFQGFWDGQDIDVRVGLGLTDREAADREHEDRRHRCGALARSLGVPDEPGPTFEAVLGELGRSESPIVIVNAEDLWLEPAPQNVPGTGSERPNWRRKASVTLEALAASPAAARALAVLSEARAETPS